MSLENPDPRTSAIAAAHVADHVWPLTEVLALLD
jgi:hypothetical protein